MKAGFIIALALIIATLIFIPTASASAGCYELTIQGYPWDPSIVYYVETPTHGAAVNYAKQAEALYPGISITISKVACA
jgi:hypothetical protein